MEPTLETDSDFAGNPVKTRYPKLFGAALFLVNCLAALGAGPVLIAEMFVIGGNLFAFVGLFLPILSICLIVSAFFAWSRNYVVGLATVFVAILVLLFTVGVLNEEHHAPHAQKLAPLQVTYFLLIPLLLQLLSAILSTYKLIQLRLLR